MKCVKDAKKSQVENNKTLEYVSLRFSILLLLMTSPIGIRIALTTEKISILMRESILPTMFVS